MTIRRMCSIKPEHQVVLAAFTEAAYPPPGHAFDVAGAQAMLEQPAFGDVLRNLSGALNVGKLYDDSTPPPTADAAEVPAWGSVDGDLRGENRRMQMDADRVYTMFVPDTQGRTVVASGAIIPAGSGAIGGQLGMFRGALNWDGTGGAAGGTMTDTLRGDNLWFTWRLGVGQPSTAINLLIQFAP